MPPFELRARPDGTLMIVGQEPAFTVDVNTIEDPVAFFTDLARTGVHSGASVEKGQIPAA